MSFKKENHRYHSFNIQLHLLVTSMLVLDNMSKIEKEKVGGKSDRGINISVRNYIIVCYKEREGRKDQ